MMFLALWQYWKVSKNVFKKPQKVRSAYRTVGLAEHHDIVVGDLVIDKLLDISHIGG